MGVDSHGHARSGMAEALAHRRDSRTPLSLRLVRPVGARAGQLPWSGREQLPFWQLDVNTLTATRLTDPAQTPFTIANGDWAVSPDGHYVAFVENKDRNIWVLTLPE